MAARLTQTQRIAVGAACALILLFEAVHFDGPSRGYWDTYITVPAMFMTGQPVDLHRMDGTPRFTYRLKGRVPDDTYDPTPGSYGIASEDQRIGTAILFAAPFALVNLAAFRWGFATCWALTFLFAFLALRRLVGGFAAPLAAALILVLNPFSLYLERLNGNALGLGVMVFLWFLLGEELAAARGEHQRGDARPLSRSMASWAVIGLTYGILGGIRNEAIVLGPLFLACLWRGSPDARGGSARLAWFAARFGTFTAAAFAGILPVLLWNQFAYGQMLIHPSQVSHLQGFRPTFPHSFLGAEFQFNGLLNWPFHDHVVRTPHFAFPTFLLWPLVTVKSLGLALSAAAAVGAFVLVRRRPFEAAVLLAWYGVVYLLFMFQENLEELKQTFMGLHLFPLAAFVAAGLAWLAEAPRAWRRWATIAAVACALAAGVVATRAVDAPADERWYVRFPHADRNESGLADLPESLRKDWHYFYTR